MKTHEIVISEPTSLAVESSKILARGLGVVHGSPAFQVPKHSYLLEVTPDFMVGDEEVRYLLLTPRLSGSTLEDVMNGSCSVNISRIKPGLTLKAGDEYGGLDFEYWTIGFSRVVKTP